MHELRWRYQTNSGQPKNRLSVLQKSPIIYSHEVLDTVARGNEDVLGIWLVWQGCQ